MALLHRPDGTLVADAPGYRRFMPALMPTRNGSVVYFDQRLPKPFIEGDPFFASAFVTNLGSVGLDGAFHHLYEYGTIPIFAALGRVHDTVEAEAGEPVVRRTATIRFTYDERVEDGLYAAGAIADFQRFVERPDAA